MSISNFFFAFCSADQVIAASQRQRHSGVTEQHQGTKTLRCDGAAPSSPGGVTEQHVELTTKQRSLQTSRCVIRDPSERIGTNLVIHRVPLSHLIWGQPRTQILRIPGLTKQRLLTSLHLFGRVITPVHVYSTCHVSFPNRTCIVFRPKSCAASTTFANKRNNLSTKKQQGRNRDQRVHSQTSQATSGKESSKKNLTVTRSIIAFRFETQADSFGQGYTSIFQIHHAHDTYMWCLRTQGLAVHPCVSSEDVEISRMPKAWTLYTPHSPLHTLHSAFHTLHFTLHNLHFIFYTIHFQLHTLHTLHPAHPTLDTPHALHFTLHNPHFSLHTPHNPLHTPHFTLYTPHSTLYTLHSTLCTPHLTLHTLHSKLDTPHFSLHSAHFTLHTLHFTLHNLHSPLYILHFTLYTPQSPLPAPHSTVYTPYLTLYTPPSTLDTPHPTLYTPHLTLDIPHFTQYILRDLFLWTFMCIAFWFVGFFCFFLEFFSLKNWNCLVNLFWFSLVPTKKEKVTRSLWKRALLFQN